MSRLVKTVEFEFEDRVRKARLTFAELLRIREATKTEAWPNGVSLLRADHLARAEEFTEEQWLHVFLELFRADDPDLDMEHLAELVDVPTFGELAEVVVSLLPQPDDDDPTTATT